MPARYQVVFNDKAKKQIAKLEKPQRVLLLSWIKSNLEGCRDPYAASSSTSLDEIAHGIRYRIGNYRILCIADQDQIQVKSLKVGHRADVYRHFK